MSYWNSSNKTPSWSPVATSPSIAPAMGPATSGRAIIICGTLTRSSPTSVPHASNRRCTARFTPVTTATSVLPRASRTELVRHEPPGRSTNRTAGLLSIAWLRRSARAPVSQPSFDTGTSASRTPVIAATAASRACATAAWETITPRSGSLIVFLEILLELAALGEPLEQPVVERPRRIHAAVAQQVIHRDDLTHHREVLPRVERHGDERQRDLEHLGGLTVDPGAIVLARRIPVLELDDHLDTLLLPHGADAEQRADVDQPHAPDFHIVLGELVPPTDQHVVPPARDVDDVVRDQPMAALHEIEHALALPDARAAEEQQAHAEHVGERRVHRGGRRERVVQERPEAAVELRGLESGADHRHTLGARQVDELGRRLLPLRDDDARELELQQRLERATTRGGVQGREVGDLGFAEDMDAVRGEPLGVPGEHEPRARRLGGGNLAIEPHVPRTAPGVQPHFHGRRP